MPISFRGVKGALEASSLPPIKLITIGRGENKLEIGNETVLFRHEEKFYHPTGLGFIIEDSLSVSQIKEKLERINKLKFERVGQELNVNLVAIRQKSDKNKFITATQTVLNNTPLCLALMNDDPGALKEALEISKQRRPLIFSATKDNVTQFSKLAQEFAVPLVVSAPDLETLSGLTKDLNNQGVSDLILDTGKKPIKDKIWDLTQIRRQALKKSNRSLGYPTLVTIDAEDPFEDAMEAATYISKYASIVLMSGTEPGEVLSLLTLRQNIYTDPQKTFTD